MTTLPRLQTYDDYPVATVFQIEDLGFCEKGEGKTLVRSRDLTVAGDFPLNTCGGQLSCGQAGAAAHRAHRDLAVLGAQEIQPGLQQLAAPLREAIGSLDATVGADLLHPNILTPVRPTGQYQETQVLSYSKGWP